MNAQNINRTLDDFNYKVCDIFLGGYNPQSANENEFGISNGLLVYPKDGNIARDYFGDLGLLEGVVNFNYEVETQDQKNVQQIIGNADKTVHDEMVRVTGSIANYNNKTLKMIAPTAKTLVDAAGNEKGTSIGNNKIKSLKRDYSLPLIIHPVEFSNLSPKIAYVASSANSANSGAVNKTTGYAVGETTLDVDGFTSAPVDGAVITFAGHSTEYVIQSGATTTSITIYPALTEAVADDEVITNLGVTNFKIKFSSIGDGAVNNTAGYSKGEKFNTTGMTVDGFSTAPVKGQTFNFVGHGQTYTVLEGSTTTSIKFTPELQADVINDEIMTAEIFKINGGDRTGSDATPISKNIFEYRMFKTQYKAFKIYIDGIWKNPKDLVYREWDQSLVNDYDIKMDLQNGQVRIKLPAGSKIEGEFMIMTNDDDIIFFESVPSHAFSNSLSKSEKAILPFDFEGMKDFNRRDSDQLFRRGYGFLPE